MPRLRPFMPATPKPPKAKKPSGRQSAFQLAQGVLERFDYLTPHNITQRQLDSICEKLLKLQKENTQLRVNISGQTLMKHNVDKARESAAIANKQHSMLIGQVRMLQIKNEQLRNKLESWGQPHVEKTIQEISAIVDSRKYQQMKAAIKRNMVIQKR